MDKIKQFFHNIMTGSDNKTYAAGRFHGLIVLLAGLGAPFAMIFKGATVDLQQLGIYWVGLATGITALIRGTSATEPKPPENPPST